MSYPANVSPGVQREELELLFRRAEAAQLRAQATVAACLAAQKRRAAQPRLRPVASLTWSEPTKEDLDWLWQVVDEIRNAGR